MLSPRRAIKLRKSRISKKRHFSTCRPPSRPIFGNLAKYKKISKNRSYILKILEFHVESPEGNKIKEIPNFKETSFFDMSSAQPDRFRAVFNCFRIVLGPFLDRFGPFRTVFAPFFSFFRIVAPRRGRRGVTAPPLCRRSAAARDFQRRSAASEFAIYPFSQTSGSRRNLFV